MKAAEMHGAFDDVAVERTLGEAGETVGTAIVGHIELAVDIVDGVTVAADLDPLDRAGLNFRRRTDETGIFSFHPDLRAGSASRPLSPDFRRARQ